MTKYFVLFFLAWNLEARAEFKVPKLSGPVVDQANVLEYQDESEIKRIIENLYSAGFAQLTVVTLSSLEGLTIEQAGIEIADAWKLGTKKEDNGLIFIIAPRERKLRIEVGQGLEGVIPDITAKRIIEDRVLPVVRANGVSSGVVVGVESLQSVLSPESAQQGSYVRTKKTSTNSTVINIIALFLFFIFITLGFIGRIFGMRGTHISSWTSSGRGGFGGGGGFGRGGGGGWSGGGGGFSGGGASGGW